jgi:hypothetical protein
VPTGMPWRPCAGLVRQCTYLRALTVAVMAEHCQDTVDAPLANRNMDKPRVSLIRQWPHGIVQQEPGPGRSPAMWSITAQ